MDVSMLLSVPIQQSNAGNSALTLDAPDFQKGSPISDQFFQLLANRIEMGDLKQGANDQGTKGISFGDISSQLQKLLIADRTSEGDSPEMMPSLQQQLQAMGLKNPGQQSQSLHRQLLALWKGNGQDLPQLNTKPELIQPPEADVKPTSDDPFSSDDGWGPEDIATDEDSGIGEAILQAMVSQRDLTVDNMILLNNGVDAKEALNQNAEQSADSIAPSINPTGLISLSTYGVWGAGEDSKAATTAVPIPCTGAETVFAGVSQPSQPMGKDNGQGQQTVASLGNRSNSNEMKSFPFSLTEDRLPKTLANESQVVLQDAGSNPDYVGALTGKATDNAENQLPGKFGALQSSQPGLNSRILPGEILVDPMPQAMKANPFGIAAVLGEEPQKGEEITFMNGETHPSMESKPPVQIPQGEKISAPMNSGRDFLKGLQGNSMTTAPPGRISFGKEFQEPEETLRIYGDEDSGQARPVNQKSDGLLHSERVQVNTQNLVQPAAPLKTQSEAVLTGVAEGSVARQKEDGSPAVTDQSVVVDTVSKTRNGDKDSISVSMETSTLLVHGQGEPRVNEGRSSVTMGEAKAPSADQIHHQVREKIENGDFIGNRNSITLKLHPEELGELKINLRMDDQRLKVEIVTENRSVKEALVQNLDTLKETLSRQNISMDRFDVSADIRHGFNQAHREGSRMMQDNRGSNTQYQTAMAAEEKDKPTLNYGWAGEESLVSLVL